VTGDPTMAVTNEVEDVAFREWAIVELMGHRRYAGLISEATIGGGSFLRLDVYTEPGGNDLPKVTQFYAPGAVYCITPVAEDVARKVAADSQPTPVTRYELGLPAAPYEEPF
jgi:hypothetical protein